MSSGAEAPGQAAGYIFQLRYALYRALERLRRDPTAAIAIEKLDDVAILGAGDTVAIEQLKHTTQDQAQITDTSKAVWRTLGNWTRLITGKKVVLTRTEFFLTSTASVSANSALAMLGVDDHQRDITSALMKLKEIGGASSNKETQADRDAFLALDPAEQEALLKSVRVTANAPSIGGITAELDAALHFCCEASQVSQFRAELEGWWIEQISAQLDTAEPAVVKLIHVEGRIAFLREKYKTSALQFDADEDEHDEADLDGHLFVDQLKAVSVGRARIANAQRVFMKASAQRSKWIRGAKLDPEELSRYDEDLVERWATRSAISWDGIVEGSSEADRIDSGRKLLEWAETQETPLKGASANFLTCGSFHSLANSIRVGWHPDFIAKFKK